QDTDNQDDYEQLDQGKAPVLHGSTPPLFLGMGAKKTDATAIATRLRAVRHVMIYGASVTSA
ncbi:MAG: hypothetical protein ABIK44_06340, partial [candidate division WOR-3 bacterium]